MKELQAGIHFVQAQCIQLRQHPVFKRKIKVQGRPIAPLQPMQKGLLPQTRESQPRRFPAPVRSPLEIIQRRTARGLRRLECQGERINQLSAELEAAVLELKAIASEVNRDWRTMQAVQPSTTGVLAKRNAIAGATPDLCEYRSVSVPKFHKRASGSFAIASRSVDLFKAEREAAQLAQMLRQRTRTKAVKR
jgi:hypothetical protein